MALPPLRQSRHGSPPFAVMRQATMALLPTHKTLSLLSRILTLMFN